MSNLFRFISLRSAQAKPFRTLLIVLGVALGTALYAAIGAINRATLSSFRESVSSIAGKASLSISAGEAGFPEETTHEVASVAGVRDAVPMIVSRGYFSKSAGKKGADGSLLILGVDLLHEGSVRNYVSSDQAVIDDPLVFLNQPDSIVLTREFAQARGLGIDSKLELATAEGRRAFTVRGLLSPEGPARAYGGSIAIMDIDGARASFGKDGKVDRIDVVLKDGESVDDVAKRLRRKLGAAFQVERPAAQSEDMERLVNSFQLMLSFLSWIALLVGLFMVSNSIRVSVAERRKEIGTLRALGCKRKRILWLFIAEAALMGLVGSVIGVGLGTLLSSLLVQQVTEALRSQFTMHLEAPRMRFDQIQALISVGVATLASAAAAFLPAYRAMGVSPLEAISNRGAADEAAAASGFKGFWPALAGLAVMLLSFGGSCFVRFPEGYAGMHAVFAVGGLLGAIFSGPWLAAQLIRGVRRACLGLRAGVLFRLASDALLKNPRRTAGNMTVLMVGLSFVILAAAISFSFQATIGGWLDRALNADLLITSTGKVVTLDVQLLKEELGKELNRIPGLVSSRSGQAAFALRLYHLEYGGKPVAMKAVDQPSEAIEPSIVVNDRSLEELIHDLFHSGDGPTVAVSESFVKSFGKKTGDYLELDSPSGKLRARIVARVVDYASPVGVVYLDRRVFKTYWKDSLVSSFSLYLKPGVSAESVRSLIDEKIGRKWNLTVFLGSEVKKQLADTLDRSFAFLDAIKGVALLVGLLGILNTLLVSVMERRREIGLLRAVGMSRRQVYGMILREVLMIGGVASVVSIGIGSVIGYFWIEHSLTEILGWKAGFYYPWAAIGQTIAAGMLVSSIAGLLPARQAAGTEIRNALAYE